VTEGVVHPPFAASITVTDSHSHSSQSPPSSTLLGPPCSNCGTRMMLARRMPGAKGFELRNFEFDRCDHVLTLTVATDPMHSDAKGWIAGELRPPK